MINIISLGAGVQSSTMALMAAHGEITPMPDCAIFADTQAEPKAVYEWLDWLEKQLPFPVYRVSKGDLEKDTTTNRVSKKSGQTYTRNMVPTYTDSDGQHGMARRLCTGEYKIKVIEKKLRELIGGKPKTLYQIYGSSILVTQWIGISRDEASRMKASQINWIRNTWPLIDKGLTRTDCLAWMKRRMYPEPPRSACVFCPYHSNHEWRRLKIEQPDDFRRAVLYEVALQQAESRNTGTAKLKSISYLHKECIPLDQVDFSTDEDRGQLNMFNNECEGMCGV